MKRRLCGTLLVSAALSMGGCAFVPKDNLRLEEARSAHDATKSSPLVASLAQAELRKAQETLELAAAARDTLQDVAEADHLAYMAKQRFAIAVEVARRDAALTKF